MSDFVDSLHEVFELLGPISVRRMFGGWGVYLDGCMFGLVADDTLYLKADAENAEAFDHAGLEPFTFVSRGRPVRMSFRRAPEEIFEDRDLAAEWAGAALAAARRARDRPRSRRSARSGRQT